MNILHQVKQFEELLKSYQPNNTALNALKQTKLLLLVAPTSTGRNRVIKELVGTSKYHYLLSDTTREPRVNDGVLEQNGVEYWFRSEKEFLENLKQGEYIGAALVHRQQASGISLREIQVARSQHKIPVTDVEIHGARTIHSLHSGATCIFMLPPSFDEWQRRLQSRGNMDGQERYRRMQSAYAEIKHALQAGYYHFVVNEDYKETAHIIDGLMNGDFQRNTRKNAERIAEGILEHVERYLSV